MIRSIASNHTTMKMLIVKVIRQEGGIGSFFTVCGLV